jgi:citrate lyase subunit beta / citryl-CoA lyase
MSRPPLPLWRSMLFVPVLNQRFIDGAPQRGADAIQLDLEDSIPADFKDQARQAVAAAAGALCVQGVDVVVRINRPWRLAIRDLEASVSANVTAINLPKVPNAAHVRAVAEILDELEAEAGLTPGHTRLVLMVETAEGLLNLNDIATASPRTVALTIGAEDLALSMGMEPEPDALYLPNVQVVAAARAAGILPIGYVGTVAHFADQKAFADTARRARRLGFAGGFCIHPDQVPILNAAFSPSDAEAEAARDLIAVYDAAAREGRGAITYDGQMIDQPVADRARALLERHRAAGERAATGSHHSR